MTNKLVTNTDLKIGQTVYFEDENGGYTGKIHAFPDEKMSEFFIEEDGENSISIMPKGQNRAKFIPLSQIIIKQ